MSKASESAAPDAAAIGLRVDVSGLVVRRGARRVLDNLSFQLAAGDLLVITGPAGCGKSTLLQTLAGVLSVDAGEIQVGGRPAAEALAAGQVGAVFQRDSLLPELTVLENLLLPLMVGRRLPRRVAMIRAQVLLAQFGLVDIMHARPGRLSDALRRRALLARVMAVQPELLLLDDILAGLDAAGRALIVRILSPPSGRVATIIATTSRPEDFSQDAGGMLLLPEGTAIRYTDTL
ncbi:ATP-binding cassette domain-containing protein [Thiorhodovibrio frisius]|uniref:ABC-type polar amino acid transport system, ATPase component n=1 Tax=Thiorhodovibrio frisius TaxID=631362 RepID=H8YZA7_9GAMM|nr:ATP-binding cassette domain-containing protein [Thiorhodovibrio frisius]EIC22034.1 ABC-type polar amino acid transport system, ATPase component [Thiorhodovibrio frisius]WPL24325.1 Bicarbonate transport ATP-binding protein CmpD [Thiorhodovibrio frisius]